MDSRNPAPTVRHCGRSSELDVARADDEPLLFEGTPAPGLTVAAHQSDVMPILGPPVGRAQVGNDASYLRYRE
jgi:hypothetical protein